MRPSPLLLLMLLVLPAPLAAADWPEPKAAYSALRTMTGAGFQMTGRVHHDHGKERFETNQQGNDTVMIRRPDIEKLYMVMPAMNMAMEMALTKGALMPSAEDYRGPEPQVVGRETLDGEQTTRFRTETQQAQGTYVVDVWVTDDGIALRMEGTGPQGDFQMVLSELRRGPQDPALFEPPPGVQIMPGNPAMMGQMGGGG